MSLSGMDPRFSADPRVTDLSAQDRQHEVSAAMNGAGGGQQPTLHGSNGETSTSPAQHVTVPGRPYSPSRPPTSAEIDAVIAAAMANAPPAPPPQSNHSDFGDGLHRSVTPLMTNLLPAAVGADGRVNLFVGNLPYRVRWQDLKDLFRKAGTVLRADVSLGPDNRSRGYGTVLMGSREDAARAIDRFNGYTWQTRTLEVRPDRLPPEYEAQPHVHPAHGLGHARPPPPFGYGHPPFPGQMPGGGGPPWLPGGQRPPGPPYQGGLPPGMMGMLPMGPGHQQHPNQHLSPHVPPSQLSGSGASPPHGMHMPSSSISSIYSGMSPALAAQHSGPAQGLPGPTASPLAGPLSGPGLAPPTGTVASALAARRDSSSPFHHGAAGAAVQIIHAEPGKMSSPSPALSLSRPSSTNAGGQPTHQTAPSSQSLPHAGGTAEGLPGRSGPPGPLGPLPPPLLAGVKAMGGPLAGGDALRRSSVVSDAVAPMALEGLASQAVSLGPPENLHHRVVFVSNLPLTMQWQDLKDLLRPAGLIIRADIAQDDHRKPRGYGTALFATIADAARAVDMFNEMDVGGQQIRVYLERDAHLHPPRSDPPSGPASTAPASDAGADETGSDARVGSARSEQASAAAKLPWVINTGAATQAITPNRGAAQAQGRINGTGSGLHAQTPAFRHFAHPGPISMPSFSPMDHGNLPSPLQTGRLPPMTPSMPGFVFNAYPETPPVHHHAILSPDIPGPFSPGIPVTSPTQFSFSNPFLNAAPGAPVNPYPHAGSAALGTPTTQSFPSFGQAAGSGARDAAGASRQSFSQVGSAEYFPPVTTGDSPVGSVGDAGSRAPAANTASGAAKPLNAKDRLASTTGDEMVDLNRLTLEDDPVDEMAGPTASGRRQTPPSPIGGARRTSAVSHSGAAGGDGPGASAGRKGAGAFWESRAFGAGGNGAAQGSTSQGPAHARLNQLAAAATASGADGAVFGDERAGRQSLDEHRPSFGLHPSEGERRASFGACTK